MKNYARSQKVISLIPDGFIGFFSSPNPSRLTTVVLGLTQLLINQVPGSLIWGKEQQLHEDDNLNAICVTLLPRENVGALTS
jgi:hypothetical protein